MGLRICSAEGTLHVQLLAWHSHLGPVRPALRRFPSILLPYDIPLVLMLRWQSLPRPMALQPCLTMPLFSRYSATHLSVLNTLRDAMRSPPFFFLKTRRLRRSSDATRPCINTVYIPD